MSLASPQDWIACALELPLFVLEFSLCDSKCTFAFPQVQQLRLLAWLVNESQVKNPLATPPAKGTAQSPAFASHPLDERSALWSDDFDTEDEYELLPVEAAENFVSPSNNRPASGNSAVCAHHCSIDIRTQMHRVLITQN